ncbi:MAG: hypothetical protein CL431_09000 [Acidimicrobiaceae bacterium]|jgi:histidine triad (HIT) family protein|nr:hypothetical protein [Acidimicrobiaceae bacterium]|tara:strand:+ start:35319 stop:35756 length:438 start_codon:yes stop_codon:yes gene_type:complete
MASVFTDIINGNLPSHAIWRDEKCVAFLSINPISNGHCLVVPIAEIDHWIDLPLDLVEHLMRVASIIGHSQMEIFEPNRIGQMIAGFEVPHTHLHVIPINDMSDMDFRNAEVSVDKSHLAKNAKLIRASLVRSGLTSTVESFSIQ